MENTFNNAFVVEFPLRGEWMSPNTPGKKVPSHGTNFFGQRYAFDFWQVNWKISKTNFYDEKKIKYYFSKIPLKACYSWGKEIYAPCDGRIIKMEDGFKERPGLNYFLDIIGIIKNSIILDLKKLKIQSIAGNYIIMECAENIYAFLAHFQNGSIAVKLGDDVKRGQVMGKVGHSGNSTAPHLHFQIMNNADLLAAKGIPCVFEKYEIFKEDRWEIVENGIPSDKDVIRFN